MSPIIQIVVKIVDKRHIKWVATRVPMVSEVEFL